MRRYDSEFLSSWIPSPEFHRPDGYSRFENTNQKLTMALEVERTRKSMRSYDNLSEFYDHYASSDFKVLWMVETVSLMNKINKSMGLDNDKTSMHNFILVKDFYKQGWQISIRLGSDKGESVFDLMCAKPQYSVSQPPVSLTHKCVQRKGLSYRKESENCIESKF